MYIQYFIPIWAEPSAVASAVGSAVVSAVVSAGAPAVSSGAGSIVEGISWGSFVKGSWGRCSIEGRVCLYTRSPDPAPTVLHINPSLYPRSLMLGIYFH